MMVVKDSNVVIKIVKNVSRLMMYISIKLKLIFQIVVAIIVI